MDKTELSDALAAIGNAANRALAALADDEPTDTVAVVEHDYHAEELERIEAAADATVKVIEAEAAADVARIEAAAATIPEPASDTDGDGIPDTPAEVVETADDQLDQAVEDNPTADAPPVEDAADVLDVSADVAGADAVLDTVLEVSDPVEDIAPTPSSWYTRKRGGGGFRLFGGAAK